MSELVRYAVVDGVATLAMDDGKANVMSEAMLQALDAGFDRAQADGATVLLTGRPGMFSGGFDLAVFKTDPAALFRMLEAGARLTEKVLSFPYPVVAACSGHAIAMGAFLLLSTDLRIGVDQGARIQINEVKIGLTLPRFATEVCRQRLSPAHFSRAVLTAEPYSGQQAVVAGFLDEVCPSESLALTAVERAKALSTLHLESFRATKLRLRGATLDALRVAIDGDVAEWHKRFLPDRG